jgi:uncharacterized membrane protein
MTTEVGTVSVLQEIADRARQIAWIIFVCTVICGLIGASWGTLWWIGLILAVGGYLLATIDITWKSMREGI